MIFTIFVQNKENMDEDEIKEILEKYKDKNFVKRIFDPNLVPPLDRGDGVSSTHSMMWGEADGMYYVYPAVVEKYGELIDLRESGYDPFDYAMATGEYIPFSTRDSAQMFSEQYKKVWGADPNEDIDLELEDGKFKPSKMFED